MCWGCSKEVPGLEGSAFSHEHYLVKRSLSSRQVLIEACTTVHKINILNCARADCEAGVPPCFRHAWFPFLLINGFLWCFPFINDNREVRCWQVREQPRNLQEHEDYEEFNISYAFLLKNIKKRISNKQIYIGTAQNITRCIKIQDI